jgi:hypothetical protein
MNRLTARLLLVGLLVSVLAPVAMAVSAPAPHACCMRKAMNNGGATPFEFHAPAGCCTHDCCRPLTVAHWAHLNTQDAALFTPERSGELLPADLGRFANTAHSSHSGRAPPASSIA